MFLKCKKPHTQHLDGADMGLDASSAEPGTRNQS